MRRQDLALSAEESLTLVDQVQFAVLSLVDEAGRPYGVPLD